MNKEEKKEKREPKKRRRRFPITLFLILLILIIIGLFVLFFDPFGSGGFFGGGGSGNSGTPDSSASGTATPDSSESEIVVIRIDNESIYFDGEVCTINELRSKITDIGTKKKYELDHSKAIKSTYDEVRAMLSELEGSLEIKVNYNE